MKLYSLFPTLVYEHQGTPSEIFLVQDEIKKLLPIIEEQDKFITPDGWTGGVKTNIKSRFDTITDFKMTNLRNYIEKHVKKYIDLSQAWHPVKIGIRHSWINKTGRGEGQEWHQHQDAHIAGTYYYQTTGKDGNFSVMNPTPQMQQELFPFGNIAQKHIEFTPAVGKILLFPGWLSHCVEDNHTDDTRISISFNLLRDNWEDVPIQDRSLI